MTGATGEMTPRAVIGTVTRPRRRVAARTRRPLDPLPFSDPQPQPPRLGIRRAGARGEPARVPPSILAFFIVLLLPIELSLYLGPLLMTPTRIFFIAVFLPVTVAFLSQVKLRSYDLLIVFFAGWTAMAEFIKRGGTAGIEAGGTVILEVFVVYALARVAIRSHGHITALVPILFWVIVFLALLAVPEAMLKIRFLHDGVAAVTGFEYYISDDERLGMLRAASSFEHPILFGLFCASALSFVWYLSRSAIEGILRAIPILVGSFFALSSAGLLVFAVQIIFITLERWSRGIRQRAKLIMGGLAGAFIFLELASDRGPFGLMASYLTFNPHTAYYRMLQFEFAQDDILRSPIIGIIAANWTRPHWMTASIDNHWVFQSLKGGLPSTLALMLAIILVIRAVFKAPDEAVGTLHARLRRGWLFLILALCIGAATVTFFGKMQPIFLFYIGLGAALAELAPVREGEAEDEHGGGATARPRRRSTIL